MLIVKVRPVISIVRVIYDTLSIGGVATIYSGLLPIELVMIGWRDGASAGLLAEFI